MGTAMGNAHRNSRNVAAPRSSTGASPSADARRTPSLQLPAPTGAAGQGQGRRVTPTAAMLHQRRHDTPEQWSGRRSRNHQPQHHPSQQVGGNQNPAAPRPNPFRLHRNLPNSRLSMPEISDDSGSEPDQSIVDMRRANTAQRQEAPVPTPTATMVDDDAQTQVEADDTSVEDEY